MKLEDRLPQFKFLGKLGTGGTAEVNKVLTQSNKIVALKTILESEIISKEEFRKLALREQCLIQNINFPGIVKVYDVQTIDPSYICLELCNGKTLESYTGTQDIIISLNILSAIATNLEFLNLKSIVHADLKPDNIFMPEDIVSFAHIKLTYLKLSDFSLGEFEYEAETVRAGLGTVGYMAPETIKDNIVSHRSDLFAFGVLAYQLLTGKHPFISSDSDPLRINSRILEEQPTPIQELRNDISNELLNVVSLLLEKESSKRPVSAWEVCKLLRTAGATYPFEKALNPKYTIDLKDGYENNLSLINNYHDRLDTISDKNNKNLRLILAYNFIKENIFYEEKQFHFKSNPLVPKFLIKKALKSFIMLTYSEKKSAIQLSLQDDKQNFISSLLPHLLKTQTVKRVGKRLGFLFEHKKKYDIATRLYLYAGDLLKAENSAYQASMFLKNENKISIALELLNKVIPFSFLLKRQFDVRSLVLLKGGFLKDLGESDKAEDVYHELISLYKGQKEDELLAETYKDLGDLYKMKKLPKDGIIYLKQALEIYKKLRNELEISKTYNNLGNIYNILNDYKTALTYFRSALKIQKKLSADVEVASTLNNIGVLYAMTSKFNRATRIFNISLSINEEIGNKGEIARVLNNIGYCYEILGEFQKAVEVLQKSLKYNKQIDSKVEVLYNLENLTAIMFATGQLKASIMHLKEGINLASELNDKPHICFFNLYMGSVFVRMGKIKDAYNSFQQVDNILEKIEDNTILAQVYIEKSQMAVFIDNKKVALELLNKAHLICNELKDKPILIKVLLLKETLIKDSSLFEEIKEIINEMKLTNEESLLNALILDYSLNKDRTIDVKQVYNNLFESVQNSQENIEQCQLIISLVKYEIDQNNIDKAVELIRQSIHLAKSRGLVFDHFNSLVLYGTILSKQNEIERCFSTYKQALEIAKKIYSHLESDEDKHAFQNKEEFRFLGSEIKKLSQLINKKKEQIKISAL